MSNSVLYLDMYVSSCLISSHTVFIVQIDPSTLVHPNRIQLVCYLFLHNLSTISHINIDSLTDTVNSIELYH